MTDEQTQEIYKTQDAIKAMQRVLHLLIKRCDHIYPDSENRSAVNPETHQCRICLQDVK